MPVEQRCPHPPCSQMPRYTPAGASGSSSRLVSRLVAKAARGRNRAPASRSSSRRRRRPWSPPAPPVEPQRIEIDRQRRPARMGDGGGQPEPPPDRRRAPAVLARAAALRGRGAPATGCARGRPARSAPTISFTARSLISPNTARRARCRAARPAGRAHLPLAPLAPPGAQPRDVHRAEHRQRDARRLRRGDTSAISGTAGCPRRRRSRPC
jgi:hypothetical protein